MSITAATAKLNRNGLRIGIIGNDSYGSSSAGGSVCLRYRGNGHGGGYRVFLTIHFCRNGGGCAKGSVSLVLFEASDAGRR